MALVSEFSAVVLVHVHDRFIQGGVLVSGFKHFGYAVQDKNLQCGNFGV